MQQNTFCLSPTLRIYRCLSVIFLDTLFRRNTSCPEVRTTSLFILKMIASKGQEFFFFKSHFWNVQNENLIKIRTLKRFLSLFTWEDTSQMVQINSEMLPGLKSFICSFRRAKGITYEKEKPAVGRHG